MEKFTVETDDRQLETEAMPIEETPHVETDLDRALKEARKPGGSLWFIENPDNLHNCGECPYATERGWADCKTRCFAHPCGQQHCFVEACCFPERLR